MEFLSSLGQSVLLANKLKEAFSYLFVALIVWYIHDTAYRATIKKGLKRILFEGFLYCAGMALIFCFALGKPTCTDKDPVYGDCYEYADDGYIPTTDQRVATFVFYMTLFYIPVAIGSYQAKNGYKPK
jgi:hypothetical protein